MPVTQFTLDNGIPVLFERLDHLHSVAIGVWVKVGSRHERSTEYGLSHIVEHMLFKGTERRTAREIAESLELVGGEINAFTAREYSCFWAKASSDHFPLAMDVLSDILVNATFEATEFAKERKVILEEIKMYADSPDELCMDLLSGAFFDAPLGHPIVGSLASIRKTTREKVADYFHKQYGPEVSFITIVGNAPDRQIEKEAQRFLASPTRQGRGQGRHKATQIKRGFKAAKRDIEQVHVAMAYEGIPMAAEQRYVLHLISSHLGGGMSSILFQEVREKRGLAYNVYSFLQSYEDSGMLGIYCGTNATKLKETVAVVRSEIDRVLQTGITTKRLAQLKDQMRGGLLLSLEKPSFRMNRIGVNHLYFGRIMPIEEVLATIDAVTVDDCTAMARQVFGKGCRAATAVGPINPTAVTAMLRPKRS